MKRLVALMGMAAFLLTSLPCLAAPDQKPIRLKMTTYYMNKHPVYQFVYKQWIDTIKKRTKGRVLITFYNPGTLVPTAEVFDATLKGQVDIGGTILGRNPGRFPLGSVTSKIPLITTSTLASSMAAWELYKTTPAIQAEFKGIKMFAMHHSAPSQLSMKDKLIRQVKEIKGVRIACPSKDSILVAKALGASTVMQPGAELYLALSRNMAEGTIFPIPPMVSFKVNEATKYTILFDFFSAPMWFGMNQERWDSLPPEVKKIFEETTGEVMTRAIGQALDKGVGIDTATMKKGGQEFVVPSNEEKARAAAILTPALKKAWQEELAKANCTYANPDGLYNKASELMKKYDALYGRK